MVEKKIIKNKIKLKAFGPWGWKTTCQEGGKATPLLFLFFFNFLLIFKDFNFLIFLYSATC
jgi:hypothetical protein